MGSCDPIRLLELITGAYWSQTMVPRICRRLCVPGINNSEVRLVIIVLESCSEEHQGSKVLEAKCLTFQSVCARHSKVHRSQLPRSRNTEPRIERSHLVTVNFAVLDS